MAVSIWRTSIAEALEYAEQRKEHWCRAELLRILGLVRWHEGDMSGARQTLEEGVRVAQQSGALSFELRAATSHARFALQTNRGDAVLAQLAAIYQRFDSSFRGSDVAAARDLLATHQAV